MLERIAALGLDAQVIVVDDGSIDDTAAIAEAAGATVIRQANQGKGAAIRAAIAEADGDIAVIQDADMEYDPAEVPELIEPIVRGAADVVFGSRLRGGKPQRAYLFWHLVGNRFLSLLTCALFNTTLSDMETGYKAFRHRRPALARPARERLRDRAGDHRARSASAKLRIYELPISYYGRTHDEGKKITWRDGFRALWVLFARPRLAADRSARRRSRVVVPGLQRGGADRRRRSPGSRASSTGSSSSTTPRRDATAERARGVRRPADRGDRARAEPAASAPRS